MLHAAFELWDGVHTVDLSRLDALDLDRARAICTLLMAIKDGPDAIDAWLERELSERELLRIA